MSDLEYERYAEQQRENCLDEIYPKIAEHYDGDTLESIVDYIHNTHEEIVNNMLKVVEETYPEFSNYICPEDIDELVIEYTNSLR